MNHPSPPLAVTMGDPAGIGLDITLRAFADRTLQPVPRFVLIACARATRERAHLLGLTQSCQLHVAHDLASALLGPPDALPLVDLPTHAVVKPGISDVANAPTIIAAIESAVGAVFDGAASGVVTNPIAKATLSAAGFPHPGHTEFLAELAMRRRPGRSFVPVMMLASDELRVVPLTVHIPLARVPSQLSIAKISETVRITIADLTRYFGIKRPRIAIAGLNPHAGESGTLGREEIDIIAPAIAALKAEGHDIAGPLSADTMFHAAARARYDAAIAMYHDQALIPIKTIAFDSGVNVTLGLPFVRTSPDHGTAFDIAGTGRANPSSLVAALRLAERMARAGPGQRS